MSQKLWVVALTSSERKDLAERVTKRNKIAAYKRRHAQILLKVDESEEGPAWGDEQAAEAFDVSPPTVRNIRKRFVERGLEAALYRKKQKRPSRSRILDGRGEARLIAAACGEAPEGRSRWTLRLLADQVVELGLADSCSHETVRRTLKKTNFNLTEARTG